MNAITSTSCSLSIPANDPLVLSIKSEVEAAGKRVRETVKNFRKIGELLIELKKRVPHGKFMDEVEQLTGIPHRSASRYMAMIHEKPSRQRLKDAQPEAYLRKCLDVQLESDSAKNGHVANLKKSASETIIDVREVEDIKPEPEQEQEPPRIEVLENRIEDGLSKLKADGMILPTILSMLPHLTKDEMKNLHYIITNRWIR